MRNIDYLMLAKKVFSNPVEDYNDFPLRVKYLYEKKDYLGWAKICQYGMAAYSLNSITQVWARIGYIDGWRRQSGKWDVDIAKVVCTKTQELIENMSMSKEKTKDRMLELLLYNMGWVYYSAGEYELAYQSHVQAEELAKKRENRRGVALELYNKVSILLYATIKNGQNISIPLENWRRCGKNFLAILTNSNEDLRWKANILSNQAVYLWLLKRAIPKFEQIKFLENLPASLKPAFEEVLIVINGMAQVNKQDYSNIKKIELVALKSEIDSRWQALLLLKFFYESLGYDKQAEAIKLEIKRSHKNEHGWTLAVAIIEGELI